MKTSPLSISQTLLYTHTYTKERKTGKRLNRPHWECEKMVTIHPNLSNKMLSPLSRSEIAGIACMFRSRPHCSVGTARLVAPLRLVAPQPRLWPCRSWSDYLPKTLRFAREPWLSVSLPQIKRIADGLVLFSRALLSMDCVIAIRTFLLTNLGHISTEISDFLKGKYWVIMFL